MKKLIVIIVSIVVVAAVAAVAIYFWLRSKKTTTPSQPEVFLYAPQNAAGGYQTTASQAADVAAAAGGVLATYSQLSDAYSAGADWCVEGWIVDDRAGLSTSGQIIIAFPIQTPRTMCASAPGVQLPGIPGGDPKMHVNVYGIKPAKSSVKGTDCGITTDGTEVAICPFSPTKWSIFDA